MIAGICKIKRLLCLVLRNSSKMVLLTGNWYNQSNRFVLRS